MRDEDRPYAELMLREAIEAVTLRDNQDLRDRMVAHSDARVLRQATSDLADIWVSNISEHASDRDREARFGDLKDGESQLIRRMVVELMTADLLADDGYFDRRFLPEESA